MAGRQPLSIKAREIGLHLSPGAYVYMPPLVGGFVGSDLLGVALSTRIDAQPGVRLAIDIGTNTELLLSVDGRLYSLLVRQWAGAGRGSAALRQCRDAGRRGPRQMGDPHWSPAVSHDS